METNYDSNKQLRNARIVWALLFIAIIIYVQLVYLVPELDISSDLSLSGSTLTIIEIILGFISIYSVMFGIFFRDKYLLKGLVKRYNYTPKILYRFYIFRFAITEAIGIYGFVLGVLGAKWYITLPFFIISGIFMIFYFPTSRKWNNMMELAGTII